MKKILVIEDEVEIRENILELLQLFDYQTMEAADGLSGLELVRSFLPDVIICDVKMPRMGGFELFQTLKKEAPFANIPFIFISASAQKSDIDKGLSVGAFAYLTKPFSLEQLLAAIKEAVVE